MTQGWLVFIVKKKGGISLYKSSGQTPEKAKDRAIEKFKIESMDAEIREVRLFSIQEIFVEDIEPVFLGVFPGLYLAEKDNKKLQQKVQAFELKMRQVYMHFLVAGDKLDEAGDVEARDFFYGLVPRDDTGNAAFELHTGVKRSEQTV